MRILSIRRLFSSDHSSTTYYFVSTKHLSREERAMVNSLTTQARVQGDQISLTYDGEWSDLGRGREKEFLNYFDVEVVEDYDWWSLTVIFRDNAEIAEKISDFETEGGEAYLEVEMEDEDTVLSFHGALLDYGACHPDDPFDLMAEIGVEMREEILAGQYAGLEVLKTYCEENKVTAPVGEKHTYSSERLVQILTLI
ncbi:hypothetical protein AKJ44_01930 [candidate division MSBL1 archaeon SCGC-AAA261F17]|uniref:Uncharacterized protein n=1 Tax=candidate division MSBL1 archaeon SCGC-AAA261F17 TaxID=1698274 RepID=A0A133V644_9EURY|nr:hypothetical protein AKJ44_01930 [candidate division MSBL1 archaeon SCGC-AAA261F17]